MKRLIKTSALASLAAGIVLLTVVGGQHFPAIAQSTELPMRDLLRIRIETGGIPLKVSIGEDLVHAAVMLPIFYERRVYQPAWTNSLGISPQAQILLDSIRSAGREGLRPADYHLEGIEAIMSEIGRTAAAGKTFSPRQLVDLDLLLTDAFLIYGAHLLAGRVDPEKIHAQWFADRREVDLARLLEAALDSNRVRETLEALLPNYAGYHRLREALATYRKFAEAGDWPTVPSGRKLQRDDRNGRIDLLRQRLAAEGFLDQTEANDPEFFDIDLEQALRKFQMQASLEVDGILGPQTLQALNISAAQRARQIMVNMERWRWLPRTLGNPHILVNIAGFTLDVVEGEAAVLTMRVVVGKTFRKTPVFSDRITYLVINPYWGVPDSIARKDILPKVKKEPNYLINQKIRVFEGSGGNAREVDSNTIDWRSISAGNLPYQFKQDPGSQNALGRIKFMFPNQFNVYLHDTPSKELFGKSRRDFSSGCIRVEKPIELAEYLLKGHPDWPSDKIRSTLTGNDFSVRTVKLVYPVNIHILYWTVWVGNDDQIYFGPDLYDRDAAVNKAIQTAPPHK